MDYYSLDPENSTKSCKPRGSNLHAPFQNTTKTQAIMGTCIRKVAKSLKAVTLQEAVPLCHDECCPFASAESSPAQRRASEWLSMG